MTAEPKPKILAIDNEIHMLKLLERIVTEKTSYAITTTSNALEVPQLLKSNHYDLIITDLKMPGMDGMQILRQIKEADRTEEVILITAFGSLDTATEALKYGAFNYIIKPFHKEQIIATIDRVMHKQILKRESQKLRDVLSIKPFSQAVEGFRKLYLQHLSQQLNGDLNQMAEQSGLDISEIEEHLD